MAWSKPEGPSLMASLGRVLVVEDERQVALLLHDALQDFGYEVRVAVNGHEALRVVADYQPAVVLAGSMASWAASTRARSALRWSRTTYCPGVAAPPRCATKSRDGVKITAAKPAVRLMISSFAVPDHRRAADGASGSRHDPPVDSRRGLIEQFLGAHAGHFCPTVWRSPSTSRRVKSAWRDIVFAAAGALKSERALCARCNQVRVVVAATAMPHDGMFRTALEGGRCGL